MKRGVCLRILTIMLSIIMLLGTVITVNAAGGGICLHDTQRRLIEKEEKLIIANVCTLCGDEVSYVAYIDDSEALTFYKESANTTVYSEDELNSGFTLAKETCLYVDKDVISRTGDPYWFTFNMRVNSIPNIKEGASEGNLSNTNSRAYKGWSVICMTINGNYIAPIRLIPDGWEADSGASGTTRGTVDGKSPLKFYGSPYRDADTIANIMAGDNLNFALRVNPYNGEYDIYVNNTFVGSGIMSTASDGSGTHIRLWEDSANDYGGDIDISKVKFFKENYTEAPHEHTYTERIEFNDESVVTVNACDCGSKVVVPGKQIASVVADGLPHIYDGHGSFTVNANNYWFATDINVRNTFGDGALVKFSDDTLLEIKEGKLVSGTSVLGAVTYPATYQVAVEVEGNSYKLYVNGRRAMNGTLTDTGNITCGDESFGHHVRFLYNKAVTLGDTATPASPTYTVDKAVKLCYHTDGGTSANGKTLLHTPNGVKYIYQCTLCGERVYSMFNDDLTNPANDVAYRYKPNALLRADLESFTTSAPKYLYLQDNVISNTALPYWLTFDVTPSEIPSNATGNLVDPNSRVYKGYSLVSTEPAFLPLSELRVIPDGWEEGNASGTTRGFTDGKAEVKIIKPSGTWHIGMDTINYRFTETVAYLENGKTTSFALRIDPTTGAYDIYVDGIYKASSKTAVFADMEPKIVFHDNGLGEFTYSNVRLCNESYNFDGKVVAIDFEAKFTAKETSSENSYTSLASIARGEHKYSFIYANNKYGTLAFRDADGNFVELYDFYGNTVTLDTAKKIAVVYDDVNGDVRYFIEGQIARCQNSKGNLGCAEGIKVYNTDFTDADGDKDSFGFNPNNVTNIKVSGIGATDTAEIIGFQTNDSNNNIRLVAGVDSLYYGAVGYEMRAYKADGTAYIDDTIIRSTQSVYPNVIAEGQIVPASKYGYDYFSTLVIEGDLEGYKDSYVVVRPFTKVGGSTYYGKETKIKILDNGNYEYVENN